MNSYLTEGNVRVNYKEDPINNVIGNNIGLSSSNKFQCGGKIQSFYMLRRVQYIFKDIF